MSSMCYKCAGFPLLSIIDDPFFIPVGKNHRCLWQVSRSSVGRRAILCNGDQPQGDEILYIIFVIFVKRGNINSGEEGVTFVGL